jgi:hypothetical protein
VKAEEILDVLVLFQGLWPHRPLTKEIAERLASHFSKMKHREVRWAILKLSDTERFPPSFAEIQRKIRDLELAGHFRIKAQGKQKRKTRDEINAIENKRNDLKYRFENKRIDRDEYEREMKKLGTTSTVGEVLETAFGGRFSLYAELGRQLINGDITREKYEEERRRLDAMKGRPKS